MRKTVASSKGIANDVQNVLDYLQDSELALYTNSVAQGLERVTFHVHDTASAFIFEHSHPGIEQYRLWVRAGAYSAVLPDASLLQLTYDIQGGAVSGHRLAYTPCPYEVDLQLLLEGEPILDVVDLCRDQDPLMRSPLRFDFDPAVARRGHPATHLTINGLDCRIACVAPIHPLRFVDFVFRHFYPRMWSAHEPFFSVAPFRHLGESVLAEDDRRGLHIAWDTHAKSGAQASSS